MLRVGLIDIDTTHPWAIANYINATGRADIIAITDHGSTWSKSHVEEFARRLSDRVRVFERPDEFMDQVDAVLFCGTRYDTRFEQVRPWLETGKTVYLDKPAVGTLKDVRALENYVSKGARILCGSSLPWCSELQEVWRRVSAGTPVGLAIGGIRSLFEYGLHGTDIGLSLLQSRPRLVRWGTFGPTEVAWSELENGQELAVHVGPEHGPWQVICHTAEGSFSVNLNIGAFRGCHYDGLARAFVDLALTGRTSISPQWHLEGIKLLIAAKRSREEGRAVTIDELNENDGFDGREYAAQYRRIAERSNPEAYVSPPLDVLMREPGRTSPVATPGPSNGIVKFGKRLVKKALREKGVRAVKKMMGRSQYT